jgi:hypothetical protein
MAAHGARAIVDDAGQALTYGYEYGPPAVVAPAPAVVAPTTVYGPNGGYYAPPTVVAPAPLVAPTTVYGPNGGYYSLALISKRSAASRRDAPASTASITRSRRSPESDFGIVVAPTGESMPIDSLSQTAPIQIRRDML